MLFNYCLLYFKEKGDIMHRGSFKCSFKDTTNLRFDYKIGQSDFGHFERDVFWFGGFHTSYVVSYKQEGNLLTIKTRNSTYVFELLEDIQIKPWNMTDKKINEFEENLRKYGL